MASRIPPQAENREAYTWDGRDRIVGLMQHNIGLYGELKTVKKMRWKNMSVDVAGRHTLQWSDLRYFTNQGLPYAEAVCRRYVADNVKPLWWRTETIGSSNTPVVRNKAVARINVAFRHALHNAGYDTQGKRLPDQQNGHRSGDKAITHLFGTVVIKIHAPAEVHKVPFKDLQVYCEGVVKAVEQALGQRPGGSGRETKAGPGLRQQDRGRSSGGNRGGGSVRGGRGGQAKKAGQRSKW
ncbi:hypothetical protein INS49_001451 [Diaporthe citri]|uniref:uncharacterized protein n=1 Tax=Diaporthe citri TaxID=83186 RepID=UPI001C7EE2BC|nr:uncharacterized protein INS49_001451 [Diaporthe citri]KAG6367264.1 hypothetical protein INS49_001451 [Diaporthe citri]